MGSWNAFYVGASTDGCRGPRDHKYKDPRFWFQGPSKTSGIPEIMGFGRICMFMWPFEPLQASSLVRETESNCCVSIVKASSKENR